ncbi:LCP family protein [Streptomyces mirabilis]|uniref:LCP family protein n=1 Tax=Streptomyces mirabilis TaxID=68239 RepID=UPI0033C7B77D
MIAGLGLLLPVGAAALVYADLNGNLKTSDINSALRNDRPGRQGNGSQNILLLGSDSRSGSNQMIVPGDIGGTARSDVMMVVHISKGSGKATVVSIPRDTLIDRPECKGFEGSEFKSLRRVMINSAFQFGGPACAVKAVEGMTGIRMDHYVGIDFYGLKEIVDALGGVPMTVGEPIHDRATGLNLAAGESDLNGNQAVALVRTRFSIGDGSDLGRIGLQQKFFRAVIDEISKQDLLASPSRFYRVAATATSALTTDSDIGSIASLTRFARSLRHVSAKDTDTAIMPVHPDEEDKNRVVADERLAPSFWKAIKEDREIPASVRKPVSAYVG